MSDTENYFDGAAGKRAANKVAKSGQGKRILDDGYDEDCIGDEKDLEYLNNLKEIDREMILAERHNKRAEALRKRELLRYGNERAIVSSKKQDEIERMKEERQKRKEQKTQIEVDDDRLANYATYDKGSDSEYDDDLAALKQGRKPQKKLKTKSLAQGGGEEMQVEDMEENLDRDIKDTDKDLVHRICLSRQFLVSIASHIYFAETVKGCLVKITFKTTTDKMDYKIGEIIDVVEKPQSYVVENKEVNKYLIVRVGNETKEFKIQFISNKKIEDSELYRYLKELENNGQRLPTIRKVKEIHKRVVDNLNSKYTAKEIEQFVEKKHEQKMNSKLRSLRNYRS